MAKRKKLTKQEAELVRGIAEGKSVKDAAIESGISNGGPETARVAAYEILRRPHIAAALDAALDKAGATVEASAQVIADAHEADKTGVDKFGKAVELGPDHAIRLKASEINLRARRLIGSTGEDGAGSGSGTINLFAVLNIVEQSRKERGLPL